MGFAGSAVALLIVCEAWEASASGLRRRLARGRALACVGRCRHANVGPGGGGAPDADEPQERHASDLAKSRECLDLNKTREIMMQHILTPELPSPRYT